MATPSYYHTCETVTKLYTNDLTKLYIIMSRYRKGVSDHTNLCNIQILQSYQYPYKLCNVQILQSYQYSHKLCNVQILKIYQQPY